MRSRIMGMEMEASWTLGAMMSSSSRAADFPPLRCPLGVAALAHGRLHDEGRGSHRYRLYWRLRAARRGPGCIATKRPPTGCIGASVLRVEGLVASLQSGRRGRRRWSRRPRRRLVQRRPRRLGPLSCLHRHPRLVLGSLPLSISLISSPLSTEIKSASLMAALDLPVKEMMAWSHRVAV